LIKPWQTSAMNWIVFDYGEVIAFRPTDFTPLADILGVAPKPFEAAYWRFREKFDRGVPELEYWRAVGTAVGTDVDPGHAASLTEADVAVWQNTDPATIALIDDLAAAGRRLALLSNAPSAHGRAFREQPWAKRFEHILVSADLGVAKPDPAVWQALAYRLKADPSDCLFLDDRQVNVDAAAAAGLQALRWTSADAARARISEFLATDG
jgi:putative hydrolase of the HAD superfamily